MGSYDTTSQINFVTQWFQTWSELQKDDFVIVLSKRLQGEAAGDQGLNGLEDEVQSLTCADGRPMSLFACQLKLFREWWDGWDAGTRAKMVSAFQELDTSFFDTVQSEINGTRSKLNEDFMIVDESVENNEKNEDTTVTTVHNSAPTFTVKPIIRNDEPNFDLSELTNPILGEENGISSLTAPIDL